MAIEFIKCVIIAMTFPFADREITIDPIFHSATEQLDTRSQLLRGEVMSVLPYVIIQVISQHMVDRREERASTYSNVSSELPIIKEMSAQIEKWHEIRICILNAESFQCRITILIADSSCFDVAKADMCDVKGRPTFINWPYCFLDGVFCRRGLRHWRSSWSIDVAIIC